MHKSFRKSGLYVVKAGSSDRESSLIQKKFSSKSAQNVPTSAYRDIDKVISKEKSGEVYGSAAQYTHSYGARRPNDIDLAVKSPRTTARKILSALKRKHIKSKIVPSKSPNSYVVQVKRGEEYKDVADIHPIGGHYSKYDVYGSSSKPEKVGKYNVQNVKDQMYRKGNSVLARGGAKPNRRVKDESDFVTITRLRLDEKQLQAEAELNRVKKARKELEKIKRHVKSENGWSAKKYPLDKDPIPEKLEQKFIKQAVNRPEIDVRKLKLQNNKVSTSVPHRKNNTRKHRKIRKIKNMFELDSLGDFMKTYKEPKISNCPFRLGGNSKKTTYKNFLTQKKFKLNSKRIF